MPAELAAPPLSQHLCQRPVARHFGEAREPDPADPSSADITKQGEKLFKKHDRSFYYSRSPNRVAPLRFRSVAGQALTHNIVIETRDSSAKLPASPAPADPSLRPLLKGRQTRATILDAALTLAAQVGLEGLSIGALADVTQMSKSGVFARFGSREELQLSVVREYHARFEDEIFTPSLSVPRGLPRLATMFDRWLKRVSVEIDAGCIYISGAVEFDDRPGAVRDALVEMVQTWQNALERAIRIAVDEGHLRADTDPQQLLFEIHGLILALHHDARFLRHAGAELRARRAFDHVLARYAPADVASPRPGVTTASALRGRRGHASV